MATDPLDADDAVPLSFQQEHVWRGPAPGSHSIPPIVVGLRGALQWDALERAFNGVVARHASLRTRIRQHRGEPEQCVRARMDVPFSATDLSALPHASREERLREIVADANRPFDLAAEPLIRGGAVRLEESRYALFCALHHIVADLWSTKVLVSELCEHYSALVQSRPANLPVLNFQYPQYAVWQRERFQGGVLQEEIAHWQTHLDAVPSLRFEPDSGGTSTTVTCHVASEAIPPELAAGVRVVSHSVQSTPFAFMLAAFCAFAYLHTRQPEFLVDSLVANRDRPELEGMIGMLATSLPLRASVEESLTFVDLVRRVQDECLATLAHQHLPFRKIQEFVQRAGGGLFTRPRVCFAYQAAPFKLPSMPEMTLDGFDTAATFTPTWEQWWQVVRRGKGFEVVVVYNPHVFTRDRIRQLCAGYAALLRLAVSDPGQRMTTLLAACP